MLVEDPTLHIDSPRVTKYLPRAASESEIERCWPNSPAIRRQRSRDRAMLELFYATGMRVSELVSLNNADVQLEHDVVNCRGKGTSSREIPLAEGPRVRRPLRERMAGRRCSVTEHEALFLNHHGDRLTRQGFWLIIKSYARQAGSRRSPAYPSP